MIFWSEIDDLFVGIIVCGSLRLVLKIAEKRAAAIHVGATCMLWLQYPIRISPSFLHSQLALTWADRYFEVHAVGTDAIETSYPGFVSISKP